MIRISLAATQYNEPSKQMTAAQAFLGISHLLAIVLVWCGIVAVTGRPGAFVSKFPLQFARYVKGDRFD
jgi:hypothetical protein